MKKILLLCVLCASVVNSFSQKETFDLTIYTPVKGWKKETKEHALQLLKEDEASGAYCVITLFKSLPGSNNSKKDFDATWEASVKGTMTLTGELQMLAPSSENGWEAQSGFAPFESDGNKGIALLVTSSGFGKMVNILILTNTNVYEKEMTAFLESISFKKIVGKPVPKNKTTSTQSLAKETVPQTKSSGFQFNTTNFDDGWTSVAKEDWTEVTKGNIKVLVHYPNQKADAYNSVLKDGLLNAWNILVAPKYSGIRNFELKPIQSFESIAFAEADAVEKSTGKTIHVVLFKKHFSKGNGRYIEFVSPDKVTFEQEFGAWHNDEFGWDKLVNMQYRNKFAVAANDLAGKWSANDYASLSYYYVSSGGFAGATATSTADEFTFMGGGNYQSDHSGASGMVGNQKFSRQVYKGKVTVSNWSMELTNRFQGQTEKYDCYFEAVKGGRILIMTDRNNTVYSLVKQ